MNVLQTYQEWMTIPFVDEDTKAELRSISDQPQEIEDRFYKYLEFGTGGMRGVLGAGTNRINRYTIRRATQGLANYIASFGEQAKAKGVVIAYDSRHQSELLAEETACTLVANGIQVYLFENLRPTPELSFAVRHLHAQAGIVITASHNPPEYNGYKVYWEDGGQIASDIAAVIINEINRIPSFEQIQYLSRAEAEKTGLLNMIGDAVDRVYLDQLKSICVHPESVKETASSFSIVYTPLHGAGGMLVQQILREIGFQHVFVVPEQEKPDPDFRTVPSPNPEEKEAFQLAITLAQEKQADVVIATDPDCDRVGVVVHDKLGVYQFLTGNQIGALLLEYLLSGKADQGLLSPKSTMITTIVTSELGQAVAANYGVDTIKTLTGFKYIAEQIRLFEERKHREFVFGYEESYGYLADPFVREKDAVMASMLICEMAAFYKKQGKTLIDVLHQLYEQHGYYLEALESRTLKGKDGLERIQSIMNDWRSTPPNNIGAGRIVEVRDYALQVAVDFYSGKETAIAMPKENVLQYRFKDGSWFCLRPSGTEPKLKVYFSVKGLSKAEAERRLEEIKSHVMNRIDSF
ncbi:phospho-sugar mutase [Brevibacillus sp. H7]|uniref:phospho-sugar mutase n=1 Tax=Brevibacillus sp. H7 TaxID=3349138 RepID=UPI0037F84C21